MIRAAQSQRQALGIAGRHGVRTRKTQGLAFWTLSVWENEQALRTFLANAPHRRAMRKLFRWCDEAVVTHWPIEGPQLPTWNEATVALQRAGSHQVLARACRR
jgi:Domain of unknown function (DUF3291)